MAFDTEYRPGAYNVVADTFTWVSCSVTSDNSLNELHDSLCHPGISRLYHFIRQKNLPYSIEDVKRVTLSCKDCSEIKPRFHTPKEKLIKETQPFERLSVDFKGALPSNTNKKFILTIVDEYSCFPFAFACKDVGTATVIHCFCQLFSLFGMPNYVHSDWGSGFISDELKTFLHGKGIATSKKTGYNPRGNGQCEKMNAFDTVDHKILLSILENDLKITGVALQWFKSFLNGRKQKVKCGCEVSESIDLKYGVPQGTVFRPCLIQYLYTFIAICFS